MRVRVYDYEIDFEDNEDLSLIRYLSNTLDYGVWSLDSVHSTPCTYMGIENRIQNLYLTDTRQNFAIHDPVRMTQS